VSEVDARNAEHAVAAMALVDPVRLAGWMDEQGLPGAGVPELAFIMGGSQNEIYSVRRGGAHYVLRRPPGVVPPGRNKTMLREYRVLSALNGTDVPHAHAVAVCEDESLMGSTFYLMEHVDGWSPVSVSTWPAPFDTDPAARAELGTAVIDGIARLARVDWRARGLEGFGNPDGFLERQVDRWLSHLASFQIRELPGVDVAAAWLRTHVPATFEPGIIHGDYQFANVMFGHERPGHLAAIVDWEMSTIGDPLLDLGWVLQSWPGDESNRMSAYGDLSGMPARDEMLELYARVSGRPVDAIDYYVVLARFKLGIVLEGGYAAYKSGKSTNVRVEGYESIVLELLAGAADLARASSLPATS
jgi:aminoglycoside phosphotransferase (APT) family kinase protein